MKTLEPTAIIEYLECRGAKLTRNGDKIRINAPVGLVTPEIRRMIVDAKSIILALVDRQESGVTVWARKASRFLSLFPDADERSGLRDQFESEAATARSNGLSLIESERAAYEAITADYAP